MTDKRTFFKSGAMLAAVALSMRGISLLFNRFITEKVGAEGMGLLSLTMSVYAFAVTFAGRRVIPHSPGTERQPSLSHCSPSAAII